MKHKKTKGIIALTGIVSLAAASFTMRPGYIFAEGSFANKYIDTPTLPTANDSKKNIALVDIYSYSELFDRTTLLIDMKRMMELKKNTETLDSLVAEAKNVLSIPQVFKKEYTDSIVNHYVDSISNRPMINQEALVNSILDTVGNYTTVITKYFIKASIREESWYDPKIKSKADANGLLQLLSDTWGEFGEGSYQRNVRNPVRNTRAGIKYNLWLEKFIEDNYTQSAGRNLPKWSELSILDKQKLVAAAYNGGPGRLKRRKFDMEKMPKESQDHAEKIMNAMNEFYVEDLFKNIAFYRNKIEQDKSDIRTNVVNSGIYYAFLPEFKPIVPKS